MDMRTKVYTLLFNIGVLVLMLWLALEVNPCFVFLGVGIFIRPILRFFGVLKDLDERELANDGLSSTITLIITVLLAMLLFTMKIDLSWDLLIIFVIVPLVTKAALFASLTFSREGVITYVGRIMGLILVLFALISHGFSFETLMESIPGLLILLFTELSRKWRWPGIFFFVFLGVVTYFYVQRMENPGILVTYVLFSIPLLILGLRSLKVE